jgi:outer membrane protein assembly factor BamB
MQRCRLFLGVIFILVSRAGADEFSSGRLDNWHQWRGPEATGVAPRGDPPIRWSPSENIRWKTPVPGEGSASAIVWNDNVFILTAIETERVGQAGAQRPDQKTTPPDKVYQFVVLCIDRATGKIRWQRIAAEKIPHEGRQPTNTYASASPTTDGQRVYVSFGSQGIYAYDMEGTLCWQRDLGQMRTRYGWGEGASPALYGDTLVINWDHEDQSFLVALDARGGQTRWKVDRDEPTSWSTPLIVPHDGQVQVITSATRRIRSYDLGTGQLLWECGGLTTNVVASPVGAQGVVYCVSAYEHSAALAIPLSARGDVTDTDQLAWRYDRGTPYVPSPLLYEGRLYFTRGNSTVMTVLDVKTGQPQNEMVRLAGLRGNIYASPVVAAGRIYFVGREGTTVVLEPGAEPAVLAVNELDDPMDASPAIVGRQMFLRARSHLYCVEAPVGRDQRD